MGDDTPPYIILGLLVILCVGVGLIFFLGRRRKIKGLEANGLPAEARVVSIHRDRSRGIEENFPDFALWVRHGSDDQSAMGWLRMSYWTVRASFPELIEASKSPQPENDSSELQSTKIPILVDPNDPESMIVDYSRVQKKRGGFAKLNEG